MANTSLLQTEQAARRKVLLIEPSAERDSGLAELFDPSFWKMNYADKNETALELAKAKVIDLILTNAATTCSEDIVLLQKLRIMRPHMRVIILTNERVPGDIVKAIQNHAFSYFAMPIARDNLRELIEQSLTEPPWDDGIEMIQGSSEYVVLAVRCDLGTLERLIQFLRESLTLPVVESEEVAFAFREVLLNAMEHGGQFDSEKFVEICYLKAKRMVMCRVKDPGEGFSMQEVRDAEAGQPLAKYAEQMQGLKKMEMPPRGLGIMMARHFLDELVFNEKGNEAFLIKYLPQQSGAGAWQR